MGDEETHKFLASLDFRTIHYKHKKISATVITTDILLSHLSGIVISKDGSSKKYTQPRRNKA